MPTQASALTLQFLEWVTSGSRTYADAMDAWRTSCPRLSIWEDALDAGLIEIEGGASKSLAHVRLTSRGTQALAEQTPAI